MEIENEINTENIILNLVESNAKKIANLIILCGKMFIYKTRCRQEMLDFTKFQNFIYAVKETEHYIACKNANTILHNIKWEGIKQ